MRLCQVCLSLDFGSIMETDPSELYQVVEGFSKLFLYTPYDVTITCPGKPFIPYHKSLDDLNTSSKICELCSLLQPSINTTITKIQNTRLAPSYELFIAGLKGAQGLQIIAYDKGQQTRRLNCWLVGGLGFVVDTGEHIASMLLLSLYCSGLLID